ncbi:hypothetical protein ABBQ32_007653 [Trebouxia sp. C0010 RCD-2024]
MPALILATNVSKPSGDQDVVAKRLSSEICKAFPKDEAKMLVTIRKDDTLIFGGSSKPAALAQLYYAAGGFGLDIHLKMTKLIQGILEQDLQIEPDSYARYFCLISRLQHQYSDACVQHMVIPQHDS